MSLATRRSKGVGLANEVDPVVATADLVDFFGVSDQTIANLTAKGVLARIGRGRYHLRASTRAYIGHLREQAAGRAAGDESDEPDAAPDLAKERALLARAQREGQVMKNALLRGELLPVGDVEASVSAVLGSVRARLLTLPDKLSHRVVGVESFARAKEVLTGGVHEVLDEISATPVVVVAAVDRARRRIGREADGDALDGADEGSAAGVDQPMGGRAPLPQPRGVGRAGKVEH